MPYAGGKQALAPRIVALMPAHRHYVEPFAGALSVLLAKPVSTIETVNDLDSEIVTFWQVLRERPDELERMCALTPHSRELLNLVRQPAPGATDLEKAWRVWVRLTQGRGARHTAHQDGWRFTHGGNRMSTARYLDGYLARIVPAAQRLRMVSLEHRPALDVIKCYDRSDTLFYVDPPYLGSTRYGSQYAHEMISEDDHAELLHALKICRGKVMLSGYRSPLYEDALEDWLRIDLNGHAMTGAARTESIWLNYQPDHQLFQKEPDHDQ